MKDVQNHVVPFEKFFLMKDVTYDGLIGNGVHVYDAAVQDKPSKVLMSSVIRSDEEELWRSTREFLSDILAMFSETIQGVFHFELLTIDLQKGLSQFQQDVFMRTLLSHITQLHVGDSVIVEHTSMSAVFKKCASEDRGQIIFRSYVKTCDVSDDSLGSIVRSAAEHSRIYDGSVHVVIHDLSQTPIYDPHNDEQQQYFKQLNTKMQNHFADHFDQIYMMDNKGAHPIYQPVQFELGF